jgi:hypothetical protein
LSRDQPRKGSRRRGRMQPCDVCCFTDRRSGNPSSTDLRHTLAWPRHPLCQLHAYPMRKPVKPFIETMVTGSDNRLEGTPDMGAMYPAIEACKSAPSRCYQYLCCGDVSIVSWFKVQDREGKATGMQSRYGQPVRSFIFDRAPCDGARRWKVVRVG